MPKSVIWSYSFESLKKVRTSTRVAENSNNNRLFSVDTGRKLNVHNTFRRHPERLLNVLHTLNLHPVSTRLTQVWDKQLTLLTLLYIYIGFIVYLPCLLHITCCMESFLIRNLSTLTNVKESLKGFPQKVSPTSFVMFFKAANRKEIFWDACIKFKSL